MAQFVFDAAKAALGAGTLAWEPASPIRVLLIGDGFVPTAGDLNLTDIVAHECSGPGYARQTLAGETVTMDVPNNRALCDASDVSWAGANFGSCTGVVLFLRVGGTDNAAADLPILYADFPSTTNGGTLLLQWSDVPAAVIVLA